MKSIFVVLLLSAVSYQAQAFFPKLNCYAKGSGNTPLTLQYIDDGMISVSYKWSSCELDVNLKGDASQEWVRFDNNNGNIDDKLFNTRCKPVLFSMFPAKTEILTDIQWLDLSRKIANGRLEGDDSLEYPAKLYYFINNGDGPGPLVFENLSCKKAN